MSRHHDIRPVERECICLERRAEEAHIADCNTRFKVKFFRSWLGVREDFYADAAGQRILGGVHGSGLLN